ncbi:hypothetical protein [Paraburkholderia sp. J8-2]|uniref:hypothetical protein n=1 Tax=Paraburkholderia sp. J8-2 TaxID=2805440 RepID=UPI002AB7F1BC|nr:hypothetical protein [Paraburkholderia sp. J8-2]
MNSASVSVRSLTHHLALAACRGGTVSESLLNELIRAAYLAWFLQRAGYGNEPREIFKAAELAIEIALARAHQTGEWILPDDAVPIFEILLTLHDSQLATAPLHKVTSAERQLLAFLSGSANSPIPGAPIPHRPAA